MKNHTIIALGALILGLSLAAAQPQSDPSQKKYGSSGAPATSGETTVKGADRLGNDGATAADTRTAAETERRPAGIVMAAVGVAALGLLLFGRKGHRKDRYDHDRDIGAGPEI